MVWRQLAQKGFECIEINCFELSLCINSYHRSGEVIPESLFLLVDPWETEPDGQDSDEKRQDNGLQNLDARP